MIKKTKGTRSGFFFAVMALAMLSLVLMTVQVWVKAFEQSDYRASQRFKGEAVRSILSSLSDKALGEFANASAFYATHKLVNYTSDSDNSGLANIDLVNTTIYELMLNGTSEPNDGRPMVYTLDENGSYTIRGWQEKVAAAVNTMDFDINFSEAKNFSYWQIDAWTVGITFDLDMNITDKEGTMRQNKTMHARSNFSISGFLDPMISREDMSPDHRHVGRDLATEKQIFKLDAYNVPADVKPIKMKDGNEGNGWFFGPVTEQLPTTLKSTSGISISELKQYVLVSRYNDSLFGIADFYGAVIVTEEPVLNTTFDPITGCNVTTQTKCLNCMRKRDGPTCTKPKAWESFSNNNPVSVPVIAASGWKMNDVTAVTREMEDGPVTERFVLIDNAKAGSGEKMTGYHRIWDITRLRDMAICGFYVEGDGPSFFQRMLEGAPSQRSTFGIESFVVGRWAGGADDKNIDIYSRLDWEFYSKKTGNGVPKIKGMMGCKNKEMCIGDVAADIGLGHFRLSDDAAKRYGSELISCGAPPSSAPCDS